jgi:CBS domain containing-hemolysin-like protein
VDEPPSYNFLVNIYSLGIPYPVVIGVLVVLILISAFVSVSEMVFFSLQQDELDHFNASKQRREQTIASLMEDRQLLLASMMLINTIVKVTIVTSATLIIAGIEAGIGRIILVVSFTTLVLVLFSEFIPKVYAEQNKIVLARALAGFWNTVINIFRPISFR